MSARGRCGRGWCGNGGVWEQWPPSCSLLEYCCTPCSERTAWSFTGRSVRRCWRSSARLIVCRRKTISRRNRFAHSRRIRPLLKRKLASSFVTLGLENLCLSHPILHRSPLRAAFRTVLKTFLGTIPRLASRQWLGRRTFEAISQPRRCSVCDKVQKSHHVWEIQGG